MKNVPYIINGILAVAVIILFVLFFKSQNNTSEEITPVKFSAGDSTATLPIAYVNVDSLLTNYQFAKDASERLMNKFKSSNNAIAVKKNSFENEVAEYQRKSQQNAWISQERAQTEAVRLQKLEAELQQMAQRLQDEFAQEQMKMNNQVTDSVRICLEHYNQAANYQIIFSDRAMDNILLAKEKYDITQKVLTLLNSRYKSETSKK